MSSIFKTLFLFTRIQPYIALALLTVVFALPGLTNLPVIDRDEARYTQASVQMSESGDYINIRFQDRARNKKPAGAYWLQSGMIKVFSEPGERHLWAQRVPSVFGAILAVLATFWGSLSFINKRPAFMGAALFAASFGFVFEAHIAKTDALLCGFSALTLAALLHLRKHENKRLPIILWGALGAGTLIKGPVLPAIFIVCLLTLALWERKIKWMKPLMSWGGIALFSIMILPWAVMIWQATDGLFFKEAIGGDLGSKLGGAQEKHGGWFGYYTLTLWVFFWPACLFVPLTIVSIFRSQRTFPVTQAPVSASHNFVFQAIRLLIAWFVPFFILLELIPTKLPHYPLPLYPALIMLCAYSFGMLKSFETYKTALRLGGVIFALIAVVIIVVVSGAYYTYGPHTYGSQAHGSQSHWILLVFAASSLAVCFTLFYVWRADMKRIVKSAVMASALIMVPSYAYVLPALKPLRIADQVEQAFLSHGIPLPRHNRDPLKTPEITVLSPHFTEPSLIYRLGKSVRLGDQVHFDSVEQWNKNSVLLLDLTQENADRLLSTAQRQLDKSALCFQSLEIIAGFNYSKGDPVQLAIYRAQKCQSE